MTNSHFGKTLPLLLFLLAAFSVSSQNLIVNPSAEQEPTSNGWTAAQNTGSNCNTGKKWRIKGNQNGYPAAQSGTHLFFPGCGGTGGGEKFELYQNINVSSNATLIDGGHFQTVFSGYMSSYDQSPADETEMIVEFRNASDAVIGSYSTGAVTYTSGWTHYTRTYIAPSGARTIRIRLIGTSWNGTSVDSYFDNLSLTTSNLLPVNFVLFSAAPSNHVCVLKWETSDEVNNRGYNIERSVDGKVWNTIGFAESIPDKRNSYQSLLSD